ncbi:N-acetylmuramoyl-L-alanine amidase [Streptomyces agglomeratus]|uniref:N-acetylmuramoyl-L-alanine amidase n=1 Tax=Streptomyces agglomeratus TaxID=285458 RepID=A0A1E5P7P8_9ACTN|nr:peptidoglycan-binding protein [Streptomyces agglomeratus]OEJ25560.1 N-acetylmuramoyl-L-alanine amidase [Streptomyces agglomeratus]OEJ40402.1 N-acetylmuramoyl-L-alanine amidase [Streptomyces agglomeratus]OEJ45220.1 N-acetylmuramoyl-L-alanine amidase [Streptomyces agglomeratus]OEJ52953.1 N-acetylmuramoyl-L-alanine amidase [Streptomyces agglomeratus]
MATLSADAVVRALRAEGLRVVEHRDWRTHNRNHKGRWGPVHGVMIHHTVTSATADSVGLCYNGHASLPGPLCHGVIDKAGTVHLVGHGRTNHAGSGDGDVLRAVVAERGAPAPGRNTADGNAHFYGFECVNLGDGADPWPKAQLDAIERASAALCRAHGWSAASVIGHKEWTNQKIDPRGFSMSSMRERIAARLASPPSAPSGSGGPAGPGEPSGSRYEPFPGSAFFRPGANSPVITAMGRRLAAERCAAYTVGPGPRWSEADRRSYARWQRKLGYTGADADGVPGRASWDALKVPRVR